jgi:hypothetical protein
VDQLVTALKGAVDYALSEFSLNGAEVLGSLRFVAREIEDRFIEADEDDLVDPGEAYDGPPLPKEPGDTEVPPI